MAYFFDGLNKHNVKKATQKSNSSAENSGNNFILFAHYLEVAPSIIDSETGETVEDISNRFWLRLITTRSDLYTIDFLGESVNALFNPDDFSPISGIEEGAFPRNVISVDLFDTVNNPFNESKACRRIIDIRRGYDYSEYAFIAVEATETNYLNVTYKTIYDDILIWGDQIRNLAQEI